MDARMVARGKGGDTARRESVLTWARIRSRHHHATARGPAGAVCAEGVCGGERAPVVSLSRVCESKSSTKIASLLRRQVFFQASGESENPLTRFYLLLAGFYRLAKTE